MTRTTIRASLPAVAGTTPQTIEIQAIPGQKLSEALWLSGLVAPRSLCAGLARCGRCRVRYQEQAPAPLTCEEELLGAEAVSQGWRLACRRQVPDIPEGGALFLELSAAEDALPEACPASGGQDGRRGQDGLALAVDLGTTTLCWQALAPDGTPVAAGKTLNPQGGAGADVMSRLAFAASPEGRRRLSRLVCQSLQAIIRSLPGSVAEIVLAGNTAMTDIFLERDLAGLSSAPYRLSHRGAAGFAVEGLPPVWIPPLAGPFLGGDATCGLLALEEQGVPRPFVLADLGTNGEFALVGRDGAIAMASVPLGPALEGVGPECGRLAGPDAATRFTLTPFGLACGTADGKSSAGGTAPLAGISATGYLSLLALLLRTGFLSPEGQFARTREGLSPLAARLLASVLEGPGTPRLRLPGGLWLSLGDVEELLKVKAAFAVALDMLLEDAGLDASSLAGIHLAGALGQHADAQDLEDLGFVPRGAAGLVRACGNASLAGACLLARRPELRRALARRLEGVRILRPEADPGFRERYIGAMRFGG